LRPTKEDSPVRRLTLLLAAMLATGCGTPYGMQGSLGGVKTWEHPNGKIEVVAIGRHYTRYDDLARTWKRKADEAASVRGAKGYDILSFSTGREILGVEVMGEGSNIERYSDEATFWLPKVARGVIRLHDWPDDRPQGGASFSRRERVITP
jgi:hypothetical protein